MVQDILLKLIWNKKNRNFGSFDFKTIYILYLYSCISYFSHFLNFIFLKQERKGEGAINKVQQWGKKIATTSVEFVKWCKILAM